MGSYIPSLSPSFRVELTLFVPSVCLLQVSNLESTINSALHPPRKPLFPDPEPVYALTNGVRQAEGDVFGAGGAVRPTLQTRTTSYTEDGMEEEEGWPLPAALRSSGRRSGEGMGGLEREESQEESEEEEGELQRFFLYFLGFDG